MSESLTDFSRAVALHLESDGWFLAECRHCGMAFLSSPARPHCGRTACHSHTPKPKEPDRPIRFPEQLWQIVRAHFEKTGFTTANRSDIANPSTRATRFVGAGLQIFEEAIELGTFPPATPLFVPQPVIRLNYWAAVGNAKGTSTSFLNLCTEHARSSLPEFLRHLDIWLDLLRKLKIRTKDVTVVLSSERWRGGPFAGPCIIIEVRGTEIGDAIFIDEGAGNAGSLLPIVDFSFGLERIVYVVNSRLPYYSFIGPLPEAIVPENRRAIDRIRTATLMCLAGVSPSSSGHGRHLRQIVVDGMMQDATIDLFAVISHAYTYWSHFITPKKGLAECLRILQSEWTRSRTIEAVRMCLPSQLTLCLSAKSTDDACRRMLSAGVSFGALAECAQRTRRPPWRGKK